MPSNPAWAPPGGFNRPTAGQIGASMVAQDRGNPWGNAAQAMRQPQQPQQNYGGGGGLMEQFARRQPQQGGGNPWAAANPQQSMQSMQRSMAAQNAAQLRRPPQAYGGGGGFMTPGQQGGGAMAQAYNRMPQASNPIGASMMAQQRQAGPPQGMMANYASMARQPQGLTGGAGPAGMMGAMGNAAMWGRR